MSTFQLDIPNLNVNVDSDINKTLIVLRQSPVSINRSSIPIQNIAESAITASYAVTASHIANVVLATTQPATPVTGSIYFSGSYLYVYDGAQYRSASLN